MQLYFAAGFARAVKFKINNVFSFLLIILSGGVIISGATKIKIIKICFLFAGIFKSKLTSYI